MHVHAGKLLKVNFTFPQTHPEILLERSCSNNIYPCSNYWWAILWKDQAKQLCKSVQWGGMKILDIHICEWEQKWSWADVEGLSLKTKALIQSKFLDRYFESKIYLSIIFWLYPLWSAVVFLFIGTKICYSTHGWSERQESPNTIKSLEE